MIEIVKKSKLSIKRSALNLRVGDFVIFVGNLNQMKEVYNHNLHFGATANQFQNSRILRKNSTVAEDLMWNELRSRKLGGFKIRRQHPIEEFIADFYCNEAKLIIEIDGMTHENEENKVYDENRTVELSKNGIKVIRFKNLEVLENRRWVLEEILKELNIRKKH